MWYLANICFSHLPFKDLNSEMLGLPNSALCFYGIVSHRCLRSMCLLICSSEIMSLKLKTENLREDITRVQVASVKSNPGTLVERVCQCPSTNLTVSWNHHVPAFHLYSSCHPRTGGSDALPRRQRLCPALWILFLTSVMNLASSFPELLLISGSRKAESMQWCLQTVQ